MVSRGYLVRLLGVFDGVFGGFSGVYVVFQLLLGRFFVGFLGEFRFFMFRVFSSKFRPFRGVSRYVWIVW